VSKTKSDTVNAAVNLHPDIITRSWTTRSGSPDNPDEPLSAAEYLELMLLMHSDKESFVYFPLAMDIGVFLDKCQVFFQPVVYIWMRFSRLAS
jgi:hypothetical protein